MWGAPPARLVGRQYDDPGGLVPRPIAWTRRCSPIRPPCAVSGRRSRRSSTSCAGTTASRRSRRPCRRAPGSPSRSLPLVLAALHEELGRGLLVLLPEDGEARDAAEGAGWFIGRRERRPPPGRGVGLDSGLAPPPHLVGERYRALDVLAAGGLVCASATALAEGLPPLDARPAPLDLAGGRGARRRRARRAARARRLRAGRARRRARPVRGPRRDRRRLPLHGPRAAPHRALRRRGRAGARLLAVHAARSARGRGGARLPRRRAARGSGRRRPRRRRAADAAGRPRAARRSRARPRLGSGRRAARLGGGGARAARPRRCGRARRVPAEPALRVRGPAAGDRRARAERGGERARRVRPLREPRRGRVRAPRRGRAPGRAPAQGRRAAAPTRRRAAGRPGRSLRRRPGAARLRLARPGARPAAGHAGLPQAAAASRPEARPRARELRRPPRRRLRRARGSRSREAARLRDEGGRGRHARLPLPRVSRRGPPVRPPRAARQALEVHRRRRRRAGPLEARRQGVAEPQGARPGFRPRACGRAPAALRAAPARRGHGLRPVERLAGAARGVVPVPGDRRPAARDRGRQGGSRVGAPDGPPRLRRRRLRQDGGRRPRRLRGRDLGHARCSSSARRRSSPSSTGTPSASATATSPSASRWSHASGSRQR